MSFSDELGEMNSAKAIGKVKKIFTILFLFFFLGYCTGEDIPDFNR